MARYVRPDELHTAFNFEYMHAAWDAAELRTAIDGTLRALQPTGAPATWVMSSHDEVRHVTRLGRPAAPDPPVPGWDRAVDLDLGTRRARAAILLTLALPGGVYLYQGEELGLPEVEDLPDDVVQDPVQIRSGGRRRGRDGCRVPIPWSGDRPPFGFSPPGARTWLPQPPSWSERTVSAQASRPGSMLEHYRHALRLRRQLAHLLDDGLTWLPAPSSVLAFGRGDRFRCVVNLGPDGYPLPAPPVISSVPLAPGNVLPGDAAAWIVQQ
jgi:alpha-glucosidase